MTNKGVRFKIYCAGFLDGEGCFSIDKRHKERYKPNYTVSVQADSIDPKIIEMLSGKWGGYVFRRVFGKNKPNNRPQYHWVVYSEKAEILLKDLFPYLVLKKDQAKILLQFRKNLHSQANRKRTETQIRKQEYLYEECRRLKRVISKPSFAVKEYPHCHHDGYIDKVI